MLLFLLDIALYTIIVFVIFLLIGLFLEWTMEGHWIKRYLIGYPTQFLFYNGIASILWILTMVADLIFSFFRFGYAIAFHGPGHTDHINVYLDTPHSRDLALLFWLVLANLFSIYTVYRKEREVSDDRKWEARQKMYSAEYENVNLQNNRTSVRDRMREDMKDFEQKHNLKN